MAVLLPWGLHELVHTQLRGEEGLAHSKAVTVNREASDLPTITELVRQGREPLRVCRTISRHLSWALRVMAINKAKSPLCGGDNLVTQTLTTCV